MTARGVIDSGLYSAWVLSMFHHQSLLILIPFSCYRSMADDTLSIAHALINAGIELRASNLINPSFCNPANPRSIRGPILTIYATAPMKKS
jgi:hypothetical protein